MNPEDFRSKVHHVPVAREGIPYILAAMFVTFIAAITGPALLAWLLLAVTLLVGHFFRDPQRIVTAAEAEVVSPADGKVIFAQRIEELQVTGKPCIKISIFMSVFDVHVNRIPYTGTVKDLRYCKGGFLGAHRLQDSERNEQNWLWLLTDAGQDVVVRQVAGLIARRIVCWPTVGDRVERGERFGMIRFGSRVDVYVPETSELLVAAGERVVAGESVLCRLR